MITFRCHSELYERLETFASEHRLDRTSILKLALHFHLNQSHSAKQAA